MAIDLTRPLKSAIIEHLASWPELIALVPASNIFAMTTTAMPSRPFIRFGSPITSGFEASCWDGSSTRVTLHSFAETTPQIAGEDSALDIAGVIVEAMKGFDPVNLAVIENNYVQTLCFKDDDEADRWHASVEFDLTVIRR